MNIADLDLCKELSDLSGWAGLDDLSKTPDMMVNYWSEAFYSGYGGIPKYTTDYLLRKLPPCVAHKGEARWFLSLGPAVDNDKWEWTAFYATPDQKSFLGPAIETANTPEDALCRLAIKLFKAGILKPERTPDAQA